MIEFLTFPFFCAKCNRWFWFNLNLGPVASNLSINNNLSNITLKQINTLHIPYKTFIKAEYSGCTLAMLCFDVGWLSRLHIYIVLSFPSFFCLFIWKCYLISKIHFGWICAKQFAILHPHVNINRNIVRDLQTYRYYMLNRSITGMMFL